MNSLFGNKFGSTRTALTATGALVENIMQATVGRSNFIQADTATKAVSMEGFSTASAPDIETAVTSLKALISQATSGIEGMGDLSIAQEQAAMVGAFGGSAPKAYAGRANVSEEQLTQSYSGMRGGVLTHVIGNSEPSVTRTSMEAFDERANRNAMAYSASYNLQCAKQDEVGEAFYPTVVVPPTDVGFSVQVRLIYTYDDILRSANGSLNNFNRKNVIAAIVDSTILKIDQTKLIPVFRQAGTPNAATDTYQYFAPGIAPTTTVVDGQPLTTAPYAIGVDFSILSICQTSAMLAQSLEDTTDAVDSSVRLSAVYMKLTGTVSSVATTEYIRFDVSQLPTSDFNAAPQGNTRLLQLNFNTSSLLASSTVTTVDGSASQLMAPMGTNTARLGVKVYGSVTQDTGATTTSAPGVVVAAVNDSTGTQLSTSTGAGATVAGIFTTATVVGYDLRAYRTNSNRRNRGKLLDPQRINYLYTVPLLPPLTRLRPVTEVDAEDGTMLSELVTATRIQCANAAVTALLEANSFLSAYAGAADVLTNKPTMYGAAGELVTPAYLAGSIDCATALDSITATDRASDLQSLLLNKLRDMATRLYVSSRYGPASRAMYEGSPPKTVVIIATDPTIYRYLTLTGDLRYMGDMFDYKIVQSFDDRMAGKVFFSFGVEARFNSGVPNPLHFGNMGYRPELTLMMPMVRNGGNVMELTVSPSFRHVTNLPILGSLTITNIDKVIGGKVNLYVNNHPV